MRDFLFFGAFLLAVALIFVGFTRTVPPDQPRSFMSDCSAVAAVLSGVDAARARRGQERRWTVPTRGCPGHPTQIVTRPVRR